MSDALPDLDRIDLKILQAVQVRPEIMACHAPAAAPGFTATHRAQPDSFAGWNCAGAR